MRRNLNIELIKILSCFAVVGLHTFWYDNSRINMLSYYLMSFAVPLFFMVNGYLILNKGSMSWKYILNKELQYIGIIVGWNLIWFCLTMLRYRTWENPLKWIIDSMLQRGRLWQLWFFAAIMLIYLLVPFVHRLIRINGWILPAMIVLLLVVNCAVDLSSIMMGKAVHHNVIQTFRLWTWWLYFLLGAYMKRISIGIRRVETKKIRIVRYAVSVLLLLFSCVYQYYSSRYYIHVLQCEFHYGNLIVICSNIMLFLLLLVIPIKTQWMHIICRLGRLTMGIYILHPIFYQIFVRLMIAVSPGGAYLFFYLILSLSLIATECIIRCPYIKKMVSFN